VSDTLFALGRVADEAAKRAPGVCVTDSTMPDDVRVPARAALKGLGALSGVAVRRLAWVGYAVLAGVFAALVIAPVPGRVAYAAGEVLFTVVCLLAVVGTTAAWWNTTSLERLFWLFLSIAGAFIFTSQAYFAFHVIFVDRAGPSIPSLSNALDMSSMVVFIVLLSTLTRFGSASLSARTRFVVDAIAVASVVAVLDYALVISPWFDSMGHASAWAKALNAGYPVVGLILLVGTVRNLLGTRVDRWDTWQRFVGLGLAALALGLLVYPLSFADTAWGFARPWGSALVEVAWLSGLYLVFVGAVYRHTESAEVWRLRPLPSVQTTRGWMPSVVMPAVQIVAIPAFGIAAWAAADPTIRTVFSAAVALLAVALAARTLLTVADNGALFSRAIADPLTGLFNHPYFHERLGSDLDAAARYGEPLSVIVLDLDEFSRINSIGGHVEGDRALVEVARRVESATRDRDIVCRLGGDEIGIVLPDTDSVQAAEVGARVLIEIRRVAGPDGRPLTASIGVASYPRHALERDDLVRRADGAQYWSKYHGKNQVVVFDPEVVVTLGAEDRIRSLQSEAHLNTVRALAAAVDARDPVTEHHSRKVAALAVMLAAEIGLDAGKAALLELAGLLHDVGNIGLPDSILHKRTALTAAERVQVQGHPELGQRILASTRLGEILPWVRHHHERWDGAGYPDRLAGEKIPVESRILAVCDSYEAMTTDRPYRMAMSRQAALQEIDLNLGTQFDPLIGETFIRLAGKQRLS